LLYKYTGWVRVRYGVFTPLARPAKGIKLDDEPLHEARGSLQGAMGFPRMFQEMVMALKNKKTNG